MDEAARKRYFWSKANRARHRFDPQHVWTFTMYQHFVDMASYELDMLKRFDLACHLDGMPLQFMVKVRPMWPAHKPGCLELLQPVVGGSGEACMGISVVSAWLCRLT